MDFEELVNLYEKLEETSSNLEKAEILSEFFRDKDKEDLEILPNLIIGNPFPPWRNLELGIANQLMIEAISKSTGFSKKEINEKWKETGDLGLVAEHFVSRKRQVSLFRKKLSVREVYRILEKIALLEGKGSQDLKISYICELLANSSHKEARYLTRLILGTMRIGVGEGLIRDGLSLSFKVEKNVLERAFSLLNDYGLIAGILKEKGEKGLKKVKIRLFIPLRVMLAQKVNSVEEAFERVADENGFCAVEHKLDGMRSQIHKKGNKIKIFTRKLEDVTEQFPDIVEYVKECVDAEECIIDSEVTAHKPESYEKVPFQELSKRIKRKYDIEEMVRKIPVVVNAFDLLFLNGENAVEWPYERRWKELNKIIKNKERKVVLMKHIRTNSVEEAKEFYRKSLKEGNEGAMFKNLHSPYTPGLRVGHMVKLKPVMETLDVVIVGAEWGEGKRSHWLSSFELACIDRETGELKTIGKMATGLTDEEFERITEILRDKIISEEGRKVKLKPELVIEVAYEEIQKSPTYDSGFALRFPRLVRFREDLSVNDIDDIERVKKLYEGQKK